MTVAEPSQQQLEREQQEFKRTLDNMKMMSK
jgi:hypothetical protein